MSCLRRPCPRPASPLRGAPRSSIPMPPIPAMPPNGPRATGRVSLRFEDVTQDGRLVLEALPTALGPTVWRGLLEKAPGFRACYENGVFPILSRLRARGDAGGPSRPTAAVEAEGSYRLARADDGRFVLEVWVDLYAPSARPTARPARRREGRSPAGSSPSKSSRARLRRPVSGGSRRSISPGAPGGDRDAPVAAAVRVGRQPPGRRDPARGRAARRSGADRVRALSHGQQHARQFAGVPARARGGGLASVRRARAGLVVLGRDIDIAYRKPCFAGQTMRVVQQAFEAPGKLGVCASLVDAAALVGGAATPDARPHVFARMTFEP